MAQFEDLKGKVFAEIIQTDDELVFVTDEGRKYKLHHDQNCCESVEIESVVFESLTGSWEDFLYQPILAAEEVVHEPDKNPEGVAVPEYQDSFTWTFYKLATLKGWVTIRWYGSSNGYYSETVDFVELTDN